MVKAVGYTKAKFVNEGTIINDLQKRQWVVGKQIGEGGFGAIYTASESASKSFENIIKIEPASNGPLFTEINFYQRVCSDKDIKHWMLEKHLTFLGVPKYISSGMQPNSENRFLIMDRYGEDLHKILLKGNLNRICLVQISIQLLDILEYIHSKEYSHADIKALNVLRGFKSPKEIYLVDFGMASKFMLNGTHRPEKPDPKCKHNGTLEFCPRDSHRGLISCRRSDIESLMFNLLFWLTWDNSRVNESRVGGGYLPWVSFVNKVGDKSPSPAVLKQVTECKEKYMKNTKIFIEEIGLNKYSWSTRLEKLLNEVANIGYTEMPKYDEIRKDLAMIILEMKEKPVASRSDINLNLFREIEWDKPAVKKPKRRSSVGTQVGFSKPPELISRKRESFDPDLFTDEEIEVKKPKKGQSKSVKKRVLETNNSFLDDLSETKPTRKPRAGGKRVDKTLKKSVIESDSASSLFSSDSDDKSIPKPKTKKAQKPKNTKQSNSKENRAAMKKVKALKPNLIDNININDDDKSGSCIIPGKKALDKLKTKSVTVRNSPRLAKLKKLDEKNINSEIHSSTKSSLSISCQTSPSLLTDLYKKRFCNE